MALTSLTQAQLFGKKAPAKKDVPPTIGTLTLHPDSVTIKGKDEVMNYCFLDARNKCLFITTNRSIYDSIVLFLPVRTIEGRTVSLEGTAIDPFSRFSKKSLDKLSKSLGISLNTYKVVKLFNYGIKEPVQVKNDQPTKPEKTEEKSADKKEPEKEEEKKAKRDWGN